MQAIAALHSRPLRLCTVGRCGSRAALDCRPLRLCLHATATVYCRSWRLPTAGLKDLRECSHGKGCVGIPHDKGIELSPSTAGIMMRAGLMVFVVAVVVVTFYALEATQRQTP